MASIKYPTPDFITENDRYQIWLDRKASAHRKRDGGKFSKEEYKKAIHSAVVISKGHDFYTGDMLNWDLIGKFGVPDAHGVANYKKEPNLPTVDHLNGRNERDLIFVIAGWAVNDAKNDLSYNELLLLCKKILDNQEYCLSKIEEIKNR